MSAPQPEQQQETISLPLQRAFRGYSKESVQKVIQELTRRLAEAQQRAADAEARLRALQAERAQAQAPVVAPTAGVDGEIERIRDLERGLTKTLALAEESARATQRQAEEEAQRILAEARSSAGEATRALESGRDRALGEVQRIREQLVRALESLDAATRLSQ
jgi:cell division septum initiation protein DivIVA